MTRRFARGRRFPYARRRRLAYRYPYRRYYWPTSSYGYAYYPYYYDYGYYYNPYFYDYYGYYSPYYGYVYYAPAYASGVEAVPSVANDADQQPTVQAPTAMGAVNEVRISTDPSIDAQQWATQPNKAVHQGSPDAPPAFLFCTSGKPTLVEQRAATNQRPVLAIDDSFYQCIS